MTAVMAESAISDKDTRFNLAVMVGSAMYHAERLADAKFEKFGISKKKHYERTLNFRMLERLRCSFRCPIRADR